MGNGTLGLSIGRSALQAHQRALEVTSQNLANANTEGYARKTIGFQSKASINLPDMQGPVYFSQIGTGVEVGRIESVRDLLLNTRIRDLTSDMNESQGQQAVLDQVEALFTGEVDISATMDDFFSSLHDLAGAPESLTVRSVVRARGDELARMIQAASVSLEEIRVDMARTVRDSAATINSISAELAGVNNQVAAMASAGLSPNDFEDKRQVLLDQLASLGDVRTVSGPDQTISVLFGSQVIVQGVQSFDVSAIEDSSDLRLPRLAVGGDARAEMIFTSGKLAGLEALRDGTLERMQGDLNELAITLAHTFNTIHRTGFGLDESTGVDFFSLGTTDPTERRLWNVTGSGYVPDLDVPLDGDTTTLQPENFEAAPIGQGRFVVNGRSISYDGSVDTMQNLIDRINAAGAGVTATITPQNRLQLTATRDADYTISNLADSGGNLLERLGILPANSAYPPSDGTFPPTAVLSGTVELRPRDDDARRIEISAAIRTNLAAIAAAQGEDVTSPPDGIGDRSRGPGDGANALTLAELREARTMQNGTGTFNDFYIGSLGALGVEAGSARRTAEGLDAQITQLNARREEIQGVSIDEELINMIKYQRGFEAASRIINVMDEILQTLLTLGR
jgi:flagellar hook-associated protein 1 FlgK